MDIRHKERFFRTKGLARLRHVDLLSSLVAIVGALLTLGYIAYFVSDSEGRFAVLLLFHLIISIFRLSDAGAATAPPPVDPSAIDVRLIINFGVMLAIGIAFFWSLAIMLHSASEKKVRTAADLNKMLLGFLIGSGKSFLGI
jgi:hypothetical protein